MRGLLGRLAARWAPDLRRWQGLLETALRPAGKVAPPRPGRLTEVTGFGSNPGNLRMFTYVPATLKPSPALVVVLHGCTQTAAGYDQGAGWSTLADRYGFALLLPEQQPANNPRTCFTWFEPGDAGRDRGEALSIRQMVERMVRDHRIDRSRIFVTGLSAGGAMTAVMLAAYPEVFAAGAIIAGLPYGAARNVQEALESMFHGRARSAREWGDLVRAASPHRGPWPRVSVWHGTADTTVTPMNAQEIVKQWTDVHGLPYDRAAVDAVDGYPRRIWRAASGEVLVEEYTITGMAHGTPLAPTARQDPHGMAGPFLLDVGIASSYHITKFFGLAERVARKPAAAAETRAEARQREPAAAAARSPVRPEPGRDRRTEPGSPAGPGGRLPVRIRSLIAQALESAGLLRR